MLKPGKYLCRVTAPSNGWFGEQGENNTPFIRIPLVIIEDGDCEGDQLTYQAWVSDKSVERTVKNLTEVFGWNGDIVALAKLVNTGPFVGKECSITCEEEEYNGKKSVKIKWLNAPGSAGKTMEPTKAGALALRLAERSKKAAETAQREADAKPSKRSPADDGDDDGSGIPF